MGFSSPHIGHGAPQESSDYVLEVGNGGLISKEADGLSGAMTSSASDKSVELSRRYTAGLDVIAGRLLFATRSSLQPVDQLESRAVLGDNRTLA